MSLMNKSIRWILVLQWNHERAAVCAAREKKLKYWAEQQSSCPSCSPVTKEKSWHQSQLSCFNLLDRSCKDPVCLLGLTVSSNLNLCTQWTERKHASVGWLPLCSLPTLTLFWLILLVYHSLPHTHSLMYTTGRWWRWTCDRLRDKVGICLCDATEE